MSFDVAAETYDRFMGRYSSLLSSQLADLAGVRHGQRAEARGERRGLHGPGRAVHRDGSGVGGSRGGGLT